MNNLRQLLIKGLFCTLILTGFRMLATQSKAPPTAETTPEIPTEPQLSSQYGFYGNYSDTPDRSGRGARCQGLDTEYSLLSSDWRWLDADTVLFEVTNGGERNSIFSPPPLFSWYVYHPSTQTLDKLNYSPFVYVDLPPAKLRLLTYVQFGQRGLYEHVSLSASQQTLVYARQRGINVDYWLMDMQTGLETALGLDAQPRQAVWAADEHRFILKTTWSDYATYVTPIYLVTVDNSISVVDLYDIEPLPQTWGRINIGFNGISPDGNMILVTPEMMPWSTWILDVQMHTLTQMSVMFRGRTIWEDAQTLIGITDAGAIRYDLETNQWESIASNGELGLYTPDMDWSTAVYNAELNLSPDGRYAMGRSSRNGLVVCAIF